MLDLPTPDAPMTTSLTVRIARKLRRAHEQYGRRYVVVVEMREDASPVMEYFSRVLAASRRLRLFLPNHDDHLQPRAPTPAVDFPLGQAATAEVVNVPCFQGFLSSSGRGASDVSTLPYDGSSSGWPHSVSRTRDRLPENIDQSTSTKMLFGQAMLPLKALVVEPYIGFWLPPSTLKLPHLTHLYLTEDFETACHHPSGYRR